jgi:aspartate beta-hydroxylase/beta-hydroxylase
MFIHALKHGILVAANIANRLLDRFTGGPRRPVTFEIARTAPALESIAAHYDEILAELTPLLAAREALPRYHEVDPFERGISIGPDPDRDWRIFLLYAMGEVPAIARLRCPKTLDAILRVPDLFQAMFSVLDPGKSVPPHSGPYRGYLRYHLGLVVPKIDPPTLRVKDLRYSWRERESILFDDSWDHEVINTSPEMRVVLIIDILRPLPAIPARINRLISDWIIRPAYGRMLLKNLR